MESFKEAFFSKYPDNKMIVGYFEEVNNCEMTWENITKLRLEKYVKYIKTKVSPNSVKAYCAKIKSVMTMYNEEFEMPKDYKKVLCGYVFVQQHCYIPAFTVVQEFLKLIARKFLFSVLNL